MKNIILIIAAVLISTISYSQANLQNTLTAGTNITEISDGNYKYYSVNEKDNSVSIYNPDNTLYKTVKLAVPQDAWLDEVLNVSANKINSNSDIEIVYTVYFKTYSDIFEDVETLVYEHTNLIVINEKGEKLLNVKEGKSFKTFNDAKQGNMFTINAYNVDEFYSSYKTFVYAAN